VQSTFKKSRKIRIELKRSKMSIRAGLHGGESFEIQYLPDFQPVSSASTLGQELNCKVVSFYL
jgi:hypothetical protein